MYLENTRIQSIQSIQQFIKTIFNHFVKSVNKKGTWTLVEHIAGLLLIAHFWDKTSLDIFKELHLFLRQFFKLYAFALRVYYIGIFTV